MAKLIVNVSLLNVRSRIPATIPDPDGIIGVIKRAQSINAVKVAPAELLNPALGDWYRDSDDHYYWGGGLDTGDVTINNVVPVTSEVPPVYPDWMINLKIPELWKMATGKGVGVAIIDTGVDIANSDLPYNKAKFFLYPGATDLADNVGHGTHCAGLIAARNKKGNMIGVAKDCTLYVCKIADAKTLDDINLDRYATAINWCAKQPEINIISISWGSFINDEVIIDGIRSAIKKAIENNKVVVCAVGDASHFPDSGPLYPAFLENTISVGSIPAPGVLNPYVDPNLCTSIQGTNIESYALNGKLLKMKGTSQSNAIMAGVIALIIENKQFNYTPKGIRDVLIGASQPQVFDSTSIPVLNSDELMKIFKLNP